MCVCITLCLLPTAALADSVTEYDIWVGGVRVTSQNASGVTGPGITGKVSYDAASNTLTLSGASVTGTYTDSIRSAAIYAGTGTALTVVLSGVNTVIGTASRYSFGVYCAEALTIEGNGSLNAVGGEEAESTGESIGILGENSVTISGNARVTATGGKSGAGSIGVFGVHGVNISDATVTAAGGDAGGISCGVWGCSANVGVSISGSAKVTAMGGKGTCSYGVYGDSSSVDLSVSGGSLTATGGEAGNFSYGVFVLGAINVNNSTVEGAANDGLLIAKGETSAANMAPTFGTGSAALTGSENTKFAAWGVSETYPTANILTSTLNLSTWSESADSSHWDNTTGGWKTETVGDVKTLTLENVIINAPDNPSDSAYGIQLPDSAIVLKGVNVVSAGNAPSGASIGVSSNINDLDGQGSISISGEGALYTLAGAAGNCSCGVYGSGNISISDGAAVTAIAGTSYGSNGSYGVRSNGNVTLSGTVIAIGGTASGDSGSSCGVYGGSGSVTLSGTVTAMGGTASGDSDYSCGVSSGGVTVEATGALTATGGTAAGNSYGVSGNTVTLSGTVTATGGTATDVSYGVSGNTVTLSGTVTATGGTASGDSGSSYGVSGGTVTLSGGTTIASGSSQAMFPAPDYSGYTGAGVVASANADGTSPATSYDANSITTYKYLKIGALYALTVNLNGGNGTTATGSHMAGDAVSINAGTKPGYTFSGWTATGGGAFASASSAATTYTMPEGVATITANWTANSSGGGDSSTSTTTVPVSGGSGTVNFSASVSGSTATVSAADAQLQKIASGTETGTVKIDASGLKVDTVVVPSKLVTAANSAFSSTGLAVALPTGTVTLDKAALDAVSGKGDIKLSVQTVDSSKLTKAQKSTLGNQASTALVVDVNVYVNGTKTSTFGDGKISVSVPYTLKSGESTDSVTVWFVGDDGTIEPKNGVYNAATGCVEFTTEHLSQYLIVDFPFMDVAENAWYYGSVAYAYNNGLFAGTSDTAFSPVTAMTRQMIWMVLARMDGKTPADMDAARTWAMENGISDGSSPKSAITREQMAAILYRYAQYKSYDTTQGGMAIREFTDYDSVSEYALTALAWTVNAGLIQGSNNSIMPFGSATRAQVATILQRFFQNVAK